MLCSPPAPWSLLLLAAAAGCGGAPPSPGPDPGRFDALSAPPSTAGIRLADRLDAAGLTLGPGNLPPGAADARRLPLALWTLDPETGPGGEPIWFAPAPARLPHRSYFAQPELIELVQGDTRLPFCNLPAGASEGCWDVLDGQLRLVSSDDPGEWRPGLALAIDGLASADARLDPVASGLAPLDYVRGELTLDDDTRPGLWLPAPSAARWTLTIPEGGALELHAGIAVPAAPGGRSDGASLRVTLNGAPIASLALGPGGAFAPLRVDLSSRAGETVALGLETRGDGSTDYDYVFAAEPVVWGAAGRPPRRVVLVGVDTLRADALTQSGYPRDTTAALDDFAAGSARFTRTWTPAPRTRPSFQAALTGRWPTRAAQAETLGQRLRASGFVSAGFSANIQLIPRFGFHRGYDLWRTRIRRDAEPQLADAAAWLQRQGDRDALAFVHLMDPHIFYEAPAPYTDRYTSGAPAALSGREHRWAVLEQQQLGRLPRGDMRWLRDRYDAEIRYLADALADFLAGLESLPGETLVVLFSDHGEEFWDHGSYEHNHTLYEELVRGVLWIDPPGGRGGVISDPVGTIDLVPTVLELLGLEPLEPALDGLSLAPLVSPSLAGGAPALEAALRERPLPLGHLMYDRERWGVVQGGHKYLLETWSGHQELYDLEADPGEQRDLAPAAAPAGLAAWWGRLEAATGAPVGAGWRIHLGSADAPFELRFTQPIRAAAVLDPESGSASRANLAWGDLPDLLPSEVGLVTVAEDRGALRFEPGIEPEGGVIGVIFGQSPPAAVLSAGGATRALPAGGGAAALGAGLVIRAEPGVVILPGLPEAAGGAAETGQLGELRELGYIE